MNKLLFLSILITSITVNAQTSTSVTKIKLVDINNEKKNLPYIGEKVIVLFYIDPDVQDINDPLIDALCEKDFPKIKFGTIGVVNCKDTWIPNNIILSKSRQKQERFPESTIMLDKNYLLASAWNLGKCDDAAVIVIVGKDFKIKFFKSIKSQNESKSIIQTVLKVIDSELKNN